MFLAYASVKWWKVFSAEQCSGINRFVAIFAVPLLSFEFISRIDPFNLNATCSSPPTPSPKGLCEHSVQVCSRRDEESGDADKAEECTDQKKEEQLERDTLMYSSMSLEMLRLIMSMVWSKLIRNPNTYASIFGLIWAFVSAKWAIKKPVMMENSVTILSNAGLGMAMFSLAKDYSMQEQTCSIWNADGKFVAGPAVMAIASLGVGIRGKTLKVSIVQAALPQGIVPFVFAREYNLHTEVLSTGVIFGMIISLPITILYYVLLGL
ncbi:hypothetical protein J5N97_020551 [Dioscorea zingiberensis]|uniref:Auxin efflux carrier component n=1 Tax=Dioscorea zingiberensis TaxID=325984 RepID=A0A9D5CG14_9LILI|nr:hypothetical protein J5N97_020551 [Dioscorea zingiberensis]